MSASDVLLAAIIIVFGTKLLFPPTVSLRVNRIRGAVVAAVRIVLIAATVATAGTWAVLAAAVIVMTSLEYLLICADRNLAERWYRWNTLSTLANLLIVLALFGHPELAGGFNNAISGAVLVLSRHSTVVDSLSPESIHRILVSAAGIIFAGFESNHFIAYVLKRASLMPASPGGDHDHDQSEGGDGGQTPSGPRAGEKAAARGRLIGIIERILAFLLTLNGAVSALGLLLAAKAIARFRDLDQRDFAEYVLIGTLLSISIAVGIGFLMRAV